MCKIFLQNISKNWVFLSRNGEKCLFEESNIGATLTSYKTLPSGDEKALQNAVATIGPISVAIDASRPTFHFYKKGLYHEPGKKSYLQIFYSKLIIA